MRGGKNSSHALGKAGKVWEKILVVIPSSEGVGLT